MSKKETKTKEITVLSDEQINALPDNVKKNVLQLQKVMRDQELVKLNPLVSDLMEIKDRAEKLKLEKDKEGNITPESIEEYKSVKSDQRSYNGTLTKSEKEMKKPYLAASRGIKSIADVLRGISNKIKEDAEAEFSEYEEEQDRKKKEAADRKNKELLDSVNAANEEAEKQAAINRKSQVTSAILYTEIGEKITDHTMDNLHVLNKNALEVLKIEISNKTWETISEGKEVSLLSEDDIDQAKSKLEKAKTNSIKSIEDKIKAIDHEAQTEAIAKDSYNPPSSNGIPEPPQNESGPAHDHSQETANAMIDTEEYSNEYIDKALPIDIRWNDDAQFIAKIESYVSALENAVDLRIESGITAELAELKTKFLKFNS